MNRNFFIVNLILSINITRAFFPNNFLGKLEPEDHTQDDITEQGILQAVAGYFEQIPRNGETVSPGTFSRMANLTTEKLFETYYGAVEPTNRFQEAIYDIIKNNNDVDVDHHGSAEWNFNGETIEEGFKKLKTLRDGILTLLGADNPNYDAARHMIGKYLHLLQAFYSNTNWLELDKHKIYQDLGINDTGMFPVAPVAMDVCRNCGPCDKIPTSSTRQTTATTVATTATTVATTTATATTIPTTATTTTAATTATTSRVLTTVKQYTLATSSCHTKRADIVFVLDSSGSVGSNNFDKLKTFVTSFIEPFTIGPQNIRVALLTFESEVHNQFELNRYQDRASVVQAVQSIQYTPGGTRTDLALRFAAYHSFTKSLGDREGVDNILIAVTDGLSYDFYETVKAAKLLHARNVETFAVAVGQDTDQGELEKIATNSDHLFSVQNFDLIHNVEAGMRSMICVTDTGSAGSFTTIPTPVSGCSDTSARCHAFGPGICLSFADWAATNCAKFCGKCSSARRRDVEDGCRPVLLDPHCKENLLVHDKLTSGYRSGQDKDKLNGSDAKDAGKCSHGGTLDATANNTAAVGGINKESSSEYLSPHYYLHQEAAQLAINHTREFFLNKEHGLLSLIGREKFEDLLQLHISNSLLFVVDITGSMGNDLVAVQEKTKEIINETKNTDLQPYKYILSVFNDPGSLTETNVTRDSDVMMDLLDRITVFGGGDCPEYAMSGMEQAALAADPHSVMFVFTDASAKDIELLSYVESLLKAKSIKVVFLVTGNLCMHEQAAHDPYTEIASITGGSVLESSKSQIYQLVDVIKDSIKPKNTHIAKTMIGISNNKTELFIDVDDTMVDVTISVQSNVNFGTSVLYKPDGSETTDSDVMTRSIGYSLKVVEIKKPIPGRWRLVRTSKCDLNVDINALSSVDVKMMFIKQGNDEFTQTEIEGNPISDEQGTFLVSIPEVDRLRTVGTLSLVYINDTVVTTTPLIQGRGYGQRYFRASFRIPKHPFFVQISGVDLHGNKFVRRSSNPFNPSSIKLEVPNFTGKLSPSVPVLVPYNMSYLGSGRQIIEISISVDSKHVRVDVVKFRHRFKSGQAVSGSFRLWQKNEYNVVSMVTLTANTVVTGVTGGQFKVIWIPYKEVPFIH